MPEMPTPDSSELASLRAKQTIAEYQAATADHQLERLKAMLPSEVKTLDGTTKVDGDHPIESYILTYHALNKAAEVIAKRIEDAQPSAVIIHTETGINAFVSLRVFEAQLALVEQRLRAELTAAEQAIAAVSGVAATEEAELAPMKVSATLQLAADLIALFRIDETLKYKDLAIGELPLVIALAKHLPRSVPLYHPALAPVGFANDSSTLQEKLRALDDLRGNIDEVQAKIAETQAQIRELEGEIGASKADDPELRGFRGAREFSKRAAERLAAVAARLQIAAPSYDSFRAALVKADDASGSNALVHLLRAEALQRAAPTAHWLMLKVAAAGGGIKTRRFLWWPTTKVLYSGGAIAEFILFDSQGKVACAGIIPKYTGFLRVIDQPDTADLGAGL
jgi:hypothetical protein